MADLKKVDEITSMVMPDFMKDLGKEGLEHVKQEDIAIPRLGLAQGLSPQITRGKPEYIQGLENGGMFNSITNEIYGMGPLRFTIIRADPPRWVEFYPREAGGGVKDPNVPAGDPRTEFGENGEAPLATKFYDFLIALLPLNEQNPTDSIVALSFKGAMLKDAKALNMLMVGRNKPPYTGVYEVTSATRTNSKGTFNVYKIVNAGFIKDEATFNAAKDMFNSFRTKEVKIHREPGEEEVVDFNTAEM